MIGKEEFKELIQEYYEQDKRIDTLCTIFSDSFGDPILDWGMRMFDKLLNAYFDEEGADWISWWLYESKPGFRHIEYNGKHMEIETVDDLYNLIRDHRK